MHISRFEGRFLYHNSNNVLVGHAMNLIEYLSGEQTISPKIYWAMAKILCNKTNECLSLDNCQHGYSADSSSTKTLIANCQRNMKIS